MPYQIGTTLVGLATLDSLDIPDPKSEFAHFTEYVPLVSGGVRGVGSPVAIWRWGYLTQAQRDALRVFCTGASAEVYIETRETDSSDVFDQYSATMIWPLEEERDAFHRMEFEVRFQNLVEA